MQTFDKQLRGELGGGFGAEITLCVIIIGTQAETMAAHDLTKREHIDGEVKGSKHRTLRHNVVNQGRRGVGAFCSDKLCWVGEVGLKAGDYSTSEDKISGYMWKLDGVRTSAKGCRKIWELEDTDVAKINCHDVISYFDKSSLSPVVCSEARLYGFMELMVWHILMELGGSFQTFMSCQVMSPDEALLQINKFVNLVLMFLLTVQLFRRGSDRPILLHIERSQLRLSPPG